jgi:hypothetical protein
LHFSVFSNGFQLEQRQSSRGQVPFEVIGRVDLNHRPPGPEL